MYEQHPCNICKHNDKCSDIRCPLHHWNKLNECHQYDCFLNYEGSCKINAYDRCGSRMTADGEEPEEDD